MRTRVILLALAALSAAQPAEAKKKKDQPAPPAANSAPTAPAPANKADRTAIESQDLLSQAAFWSEEAGKNPTDLEAAQKLTEALRRIGKPERAAEVAKVALGYHPADKGLLLSAGRALIESGAAYQAIPMLAKLLTIDPKEWRGQSAMGVALDGLGRHGEAQLAYAAALALQPGEASVLCNLGLSQALDGDLKKAEGTLRKASAAPGADAQVRQNLAFVIALQGRFDEASLLARQDLPPEIAAQNIAYVKTMLSTTRRWDSVKDAKSGG